MTEQVQVQERVSAEVQGGAPAVGAPWREVCRPERRRGPRPVRPGVPGSPARPLSAVRPVAPAAATGSGSPEGAVWRSSSGRSAAVRRFAAGLALLLAVAATVVALGVVAALAGEARGADPAPAEEVVVVSPEGVAGFR